MFITLTSAATLDLDEFSFSFNLQELCLFFEKKSNLSFHKPILVRMNSSTVHLGLDFTVSKSENSNCGWSQFVARRRRFDVSNASGWTEDVWTWIKTSQVIYVTELQPDLSLGSSNGFCLQVCFPDPASPRLAGPRRLGGTFEPQAFLSAPPHRTTVLAHTLPFRRRLCILLVLN